MPVQNADVRSLANGYTMAFLNTTVEDTAYVKVNVPHAQRVVVAYEEMTHNPYDACVTAAYVAMRREIVQQWHWAISYGYVFTPWDNEGQPYANSAEMRADVAENRHLFFFRGGDTPGDHWLADTYANSGLTYNEMLRAIHDLFGHAQGGFDFGPRGEENAYREHRKMFSAAALPALTTETRGQNSWVNFGPVAHLPAAERPFAEQKCGLLPVWCYQED